MASPEDQTGASAPPGEGALSDGGTRPESNSPAGALVNNATVTDPSHASDDPYSSGGTGVPESPAGTSTAVIPATASAGGSGGSTPPPPPSDSDGGDEEDGMLRMSFMEHLEELRSRILPAAQLAELRDHKFLEWMYFQMASLSHVSVLVARKNRLLSGVSL